MKWSVLIISLTFPLMVCAAECVSSTFVLDLRQGVADVPRPDFYVEVGLACAITAQRFCVNTQGVTTVPGQSNAPNEWAIGYSLRYVCDTGGCWRDIDGDGLPDWWERQYSANGSRIALESGTDDDHDGMPNLNEFIAHTDPTDPRSKFTLEIESMTNGMFKLSWPSAAGRVYSLWYSDVPGVWNKKPSVQMSGIEGRIEQKIVPLGDSQFFKVTVRLEP